jgi:hypothetical protein
MSTAITLEYPFEFEGQKISSLSLRRPTVGDNLAVQKATTTDAEREIRLLTNLAEVASEALHRMDLKDYGKLQTTLASFLS